MSTCEAVCDTLAPCPKDAPIADVQNYADSRNIAIDKVGIKAIRHPVKVLDKTGGAQHTIATFGMYVYLPHHFKGTHMSRFIEILNGNEREFSVESFEQTLRQMVTKLEAESGHVEMNFPYFVNKTAPVSGVQSRVSSNHESACPLHQPLPLFEADFAVRRAQPALPRHHHRAHQ
jgi:GTP cyclohydrolase I